MAAAAVGGDVRLSGRFGVFATGRLRLRFLDADEARIGLAELPGCVSPLRPVALNESAAAPPGTAAVELDLIGPDGRTFGQLGSAAVSKSAASVPRTVETPNIVFVLADDLGWRDVGCYGNEFVETPHVDRLARDGIRFTHAYQQPVCSPARAALMTGQHPARVGITDFIRAKDHRFLSPEMPSLPRMLRSAGYRTGLIGKWHLTDNYGLPGGGNGRPDQHGWDEIICSETRFIGPGYYFPPYRHMPGVAPLSGREYLTDRLNHEAVEFIERNRDAPFFLHLSHYAPHTVLAAREDTLRRFENNPGAGPRTGPGSHRNNPVLAAMIYSMDEGVGMIRERLESLGLADRTIIVFTSDNGGEAVRRSKTSDGGLEPAVTSVEPLRAGKSHLYEGGIRVPLVVYWPGVTEPGRVESTRVNGLDFYPTWLDVAGIAPEPAQPLDGENLVPLLRGVGPRPPSPMVWHYPREEPHFLGGPGASAILDGDWKLIEFHGDRRVELYNLELDEAERIDLSQRRPAKTAELRERLAAWLNDVNASIPHPGNSVRGSR